jgi:hypothetical protein
MKAKKKYCLNMSSYKYKSGFKHLLPPIILKESNILNINIENLIPVKNRCPSGKDCPNYKLIFDLKQEIINLIDKITQLKKINEYAVPKPIPHPHPKANITPEREIEKKNHNHNIYNQLINSFRNSSKHKLSELKKNAYQNDLFKNSTNNNGKIRLRPNSAKNSEIKESFDKLFNKDKNKPEEKNEKEKDIKNINNKGNINKKINMNFFSSSSRKRNEGSLRDKAISSNQRYESENIENNSYTKNIRFFTHESFTSLRKNKINELSSLNLHLSNSIISPAIKITPKNLFDSIKVCSDDKENLIVNDNELNNNENN